MRKLWRGLIGLFVDDLWLALGTLLWVGLVGGIARRAAWPAAASIGLPVGILALLAGSTLHAAWRRRHNS